MAKFIVMRRPCIMEDEGRHSFEGAFDTKEEAKRYIEKEDDEGRGYFRKSDFYIVEENRKEKKIGKV